MKKPKFESTRPLVFISTETTGVDIRTARVVRLTTLKIVSNEVSEIKSRIINPLRPIPPGSTALHGITDEDVDDAPPFSAYAKGLANLLTGADIAGYAIKKFHLPVLIREFSRSGVRFPDEERSVVDAQEIFYRLFPRDFQAAYKAFGKGSLPHRSQSQERLAAAVEIFASQISENFKGIPTISEIAAWAKGANETWIDPDGRFVKSNDSEEPMFAFGQHAGEFLHVVAKKDPEYLLWLLRESSANPKAKELIQKAVQNTGWGELKDAKQE